MTCKDKKLSQLIREGAAELQPVRGQYFEYERLSGAPHKIIGACALGCALYACGVSSVVSKDLPSTFANIKGAHGKFKNTYTTLFDYIVDLNDNEQWDRLAIADEVERLGY